jgi:predicted aconitase with swiveling domain
MSELRGRPLVDGNAAGDVVVLTEPLSFWGGFDVRSGTVIGRHPQAGATLSGRIVVMPSGRGSSSSSSVLAEAIRAGTSPSGIVIGAADPVLTLGALVARDLYDMAVPVVVVDDDAYADLADATRVRIEVGGQIVVECASSQNTL